VEEIASYVTADSLAYLSMEGLGSAVGDRNSSTFCNACFSGLYLTEHLSPVKTKRLAEAVAEG